MWKFPFYYGWLMVAALAVTETISWDIVYYAIAVFLRPIDGEKPSVAVLYFENNTGNPSLDWLYQILSEMNRQDDPVVSFDTVQEVARRAGVNTVLLGSYVKAGESIQINIRLAEAASGRILTASRRGWDSDCVYLLKTKNLAEFDFLQIRQNR